MIREKRNIAARKQCFWGLIAVIGAISALWCRSFVSLADSTGTVTASPATIRKETDANIESPGSVAGATTVLLTDEVQDSSGMLWYQLSMADDGTDSQDVGSETPPGALVEPDTVLDPQYAAISSGTVNVRPEPTTNTGIVDKLNRDTPVVVIGETQGNDGSTWYYVIFTGTDGTDKSGFIRSDLLSLGEMVSVPEEEVSQPQETESEPEVVANYDYELTYEQTSDGTYAWYLYDYTDNEHPNQNIKYPLQELLKVTKARGENDAANAKTLVRQRVVIIVLVILLVLLIGVVVFMALKLRDIYYEDYEDGDEEEEEIPTQRRRRMQEDEEADTQRRRHTGETEGTPTQRRRRKDDAERETERSVRRRPVREDRERDVREAKYQESEAGSAPARPAQKRKSKNFLLDDDEFEFEFLNMEDKDS